MQKERNFSKNLLECCRKYCKAEYLKTIALRERTGEPNMKYLGRKVKILKASVFRLDHKNVLNSQLFS